MHILSDLILFYFNLLELSNCHLGLLLWQREWLVLVWRRGNFLIGQFLLLNFDYISKVEL